MSAERERIFSSTKKSIIVERNRLLEEIIEASECLKNWCDHGLIMRRPHAQQDEEEDEEDDWGLYAAREWRRRRRGGGKERFCILYSQFCIHSTNNAPSLSKLPHWDMGFPCARQAFALGPHSPGLSITVRCSIRCTVGVGLRTVFTDVMCFCLVLM
jgi:hypothetical protein